MLQSIQQRRLAIGLSLFVLFQPLFALADCHSDSTSITVPQGASTLNIGWDITHQLALPDGVWDSAGHRDFTYSGDGSYEFSVSAANAGVLFAKSFPVSFKVFHVPETGPPEQVTVKPDYQGGVAPDVSDLTANGDATVVVTETVCEIQSNINSLDFRHQVSVLPVVYLGTVTAQDPYVRDQRPVHNNCIAFEVPVKATVINQTDYRPGDGVEVTLTSSLNTPPPIRDVFLHALGHIGDVTSGVYATTFSSVVKGDRIISFVSPVVSPFCIVTKPVTLNQADYHSRFLITAYDTALESDFAGATVTNPPGLVGTFNDDFLYSNRGTLMEGFGQAANGDIVTIDWHNSHRPFTRTNLVWTTDSCARGTDNQCLVAGTSAAIDTAYVPNHAHVNIDTVGTRLGHDTGDRIRGYHIDVYRGVGRASMTGWNNLPNAKVRYIDGGATCQ